MRCEVRQVRCEVRFVVRQVRCEARCGGRMRGRAGFPPRCHPVTPFLFQHQLSVYLVFFESQKLKANGQFNMLNIYILVTQVLCCLIF